MAADQTMSEEMHQPCAKPPRQVSAFSDLVTAVAGRTCPEAARGARAG
jgi:hypothetical protein